MDDNIEHTGTLPNETGHLDTALMGLEAHLVIKDADTGDISVDQRG